MVILQSLNETNYPFSRTKLQTGRFTTFSDNKYIQALNFILRSELKLVATYQTLVTSHKKIQDNLAAHQSAGKEITCLVIANRGIPDDIAPLTTEITKRFVQICHIFPTKILRGASTGTLRTLEKSLESAYQAAIDCAPKSDVGQLTALRDQCPNYLENLRFSFDPE